MTTAVAPEEQRARGRRLVVIVVVIAVLALGAIAWTTWVRGSLDDRTADATTQLRRAYRVIDIAAAYDEWNAASLRPDAPSPEIWPEVDHAQMRYGDVGADRIRARYEVTAGGTSHCLAVVARPGTPHNAVSVTTVNC